MRRARLLVLLVACPLRPVSADEPAPAAPVRSGIEFRELAVLTKGLRLSAPVGSKGRTPIHRDPVEARIVRGSWAPPAAGEPIVGADGTTATWAEVSAGDGGRFEGDGFAGGIYVSLSYESPDERVVLLHAVGNDFVYVNGELRAGDPYGTGWLRLPVIVRKGANELLVRVSRGSLRVALEEPPAPVYVAPDDATLPSAAGDGPDAPAGVVFVNTTRAAVEAGSAAGELVLLDPAARIPALSVRKLAVRAPRRVETNEGLAVVTFRSGIDGSVQYYAANAARDVLSGRDRASSLVLSLHGASVEARSQAAAYAPRTGADPRVIVCPTNRRPFGFDWEDWGRLDALEVLDLATGRFRPDPGAVYLTGHSMGGHGTWQLGCLYPDRFAAIGPSAGWISFRTYGGAPTTSPADAVEELLRRASSPSDTKALAPNLAPLGVYILHGDADDNVPVTEAREMAKVLGGFHRDWRLFEQPDAGHWWDDPKTPGADCVEWPEMFEFFSKRRAAARSAVVAVDFTTMDPGVSASNHFFAIEEQTKPLAPSRVRLQRHPGAGSITGTTENVAAMSLSVAPEGWSVSIDGTSFAWSKEGPTLPVDGRLSLRRQPTGEWTVRLPASDGSLRKTPGRGGSFKTAFRNHFRLVVGTKGDDAEDAALMARARLDAETWYYRGNGDAAILTDEELLAETNRPERNVILYGNADTNAAFAQVLAGCPVALSRGKIVVGTRTFQGGDLACLFLYPRAGSVSALVGVVGATGPAGLRLTERLPIFTSGVAFPDVTVIGVDSLETGNAGVRGAGFFGNDWRVESGDFAWRDAPPAPAPALIRAGTPSRPPEPTAPPPSPGTAPLPR